MKVPQKISNCILCNSDALKLVQRLETKDLIELYNSSVGIDISKDVHEAEDIEYVACKVCELNFFEVKFAGSGEFYERLQHNSDEYYNPIRPEFEYSKNFINTNDHVLEIGSGNGSFAKIIDTNHYVGLEYNDKAIREAEKKGIKLIKMSVEDYAKTATEKYDMVCSFHVLEHVTNPYEFIKSSVALLKENGKMVISVPMNDSSLTNNVNHVLNLPPHHVSRWNMHALKEVASIFNLEVVSHEGHSSDSTTIKQYYRIGSLTKIMNLLYPNNKVLIQENKLSRIRGFVYGLSNRLKLYKMSSPKKMVGKNITMVFQKKSV